MWIWCCSFVGYFSFLLTCILRIFACFLGYHQIDGGLVLPTVQADIEGQCNNRISMGELHKDIVVTTKVFLEKFHYSVENIGQLDVLFGSSFSKLEDFGKPFSVDSHWSISSRLFTSFSQNRLHRIEEVTREDVVKVEEEEEGNVDQITWKFTLPLLYY